MRDLVLIALQRKLEEAESGGDSIRAENIQARIAAREVIPAENEGEPVRLRTRVQVARKDAPKPAPKARSRRKAARAAKPAKAVAPARVAKVATPKAVEPAEVAEALGENVEIKGDD